MIFDLLKRYRGIRLLALLGLCGLGFLVMGYHPGAEDDGIYLTAVKSQLNPALFPHDAAFFQLQMRTSVFDTWMAHFVRLSGIPVAWAEMVWQLISIFLILWACWNIIRQLFDHASARWAGVAMVAAMFTLPVAGTALYIVDQHLHPRSLATALILFAVSHILARKGLAALPLLLVAFLLHPLMGALGASFCFFLALTLYGTQSTSVSVFRRRIAEEYSTPIAALIPFGWVFDAPSPIWQKALQSRHWLSVYRWEWYEWLGAVAPLLLFWLVYHVTRKNGEKKLSRFAAAVLLYGAFQFAVSLIILSPIAPIGLGTLEPMRFLHLIYVFLALIGGAYLGRYVLQEKFFRWLVYLLVFNGSMFLAQRQLFAGTPHIEFPAAASSNPWLQAFDWIRLNTPQDAYFALDPRYLAVPGEDYHSFRALAERSQLADAIKDTSVVTKVPELGPEWHEQQLAQAGWSHFQLVDFERLKAQFGVDWALVSYPSPAGLDCQWHNATLSVCRIP